ncbi:asparagine synthase (glutamine-hydrolyzing) [Nitrosomonas sp.]|uniref:asparagine synthase (glutamine-hydrolyzing) n=1 Tax=Nitrosomonas sp. TaxID=42353 RepID=UPI00207F3683|nr:asparagine synthase (glutamine-hydrolyzing) [Nitrosomonas sp.]GJL74755.1 MAG: asparagine synthetase B [Nitrosomonas sp.]
MCGIYGGIALRVGTKLDASLLNRMGKITAHRGPDDEGIFTSNQVAIGMRRLSIIDLEGGHQPLFNENKRVAVVCNGEIYNFQILRQQLINQGHQFSTQSDSEVIVHLYEQYGEEFLQHLNGMYALALWDADKETLIIARDRLGIKPIYYHLNDNILLFSTEAKALFQYQGLTPKLDKVAAGLYVQLGYVPAPHSIFEGVQKLPVASYIRASKGHFSIKEYWRPDYKQHTYSASQWKKEIREQLEKSVSSQMVSDVPVGAFLSGGIDSSLVVGLMAKHTQKPVKTYAIGFDTEGPARLYNELPYAKQVSNLFGTEHHEIVVKPDIIHLLPKLLWHMDEPVADTAFITTYLVSEFAKRDVTVILSGVGGDELFGGYRRYQGEYYNQFYHKIPAWLRKNAILPIARLLPSDRHSKWLNYSRLAKSFMLTAEMPVEERYKSYIEITDEELRNRLLNYEMDWKANDVVLDAFQGCSDVSELHQLFEVDRLTQLPDDLLMLTDKMTMATSLECRVPLLDHELVELACSMPPELKIKGGELKYILKECLSDLLPKEILYRKKRGFGAPMGAWIKKELLPLLQSVLSPDVIKARGVFNPDVVQVLIKEHLDRKNDHTDILIGLLNFEIWSRLMLDQVKPEALEADLKQLIQ